MGVVRIDGSFPSFADDDSRIVYNEGFTGVSTMRRDGSHKRLLHSVRAPPAPSSFDP